MTPVSAEPIASIDRANAALYKTLYPPLQRAAHDAFGGMRRPAYA